MVDQNSYCVSKHGPVVLDYTRKDLFADLKISLGIHVFALYIYTSFDSINKLLLFEMSSELLGLEYFSLGSLGKPDEIQQIRVKLF
jgi:hypothetical protein